MRFLGPKNKLRQIQGDNAVVIQNKVSPVIFKAKCLIFANGLCWDFSTCTALKKLSSPDKKTKSLQSC